jgi:long-chain acyl-CoA synthetase
MHPAHHAKTHADKPAFIMAYSGETVTYGELDARSNQGAHLFRSLGLNEGDSIAFFIDNHPRYYELLWAAQRSGLRFTCLSSKLTLSEVEYIVKDCEAKAFVASKALEETALAVAPLIPGVALLMVGGEAGPYRSLEDARGAFPTTPIADESADGPCSIPPAPPDGRRRQARRGRDPAIDAPKPARDAGQALYSWKPDTIYLSPAPALSAAPLGWSMAVHAWAGPW